MCVYVDGTLELACDFFLLQRGSCCEVCGILAHEGCARQVPDDCRPIALPAEKVLHTWKAAGTLMIESQVTQSSTSHAA